MGHKSKHKKPNKSSSSSSKKEKKSSTKHGERRGRSGNPLADALTFALVQCPSLLEELPQIVSAMDGGEYVNIEKISNAPMREALLRVFEQRRTLHQSESERVHQRVTPASSSLAVLAGALFGLLGGRGGRTM